MNENVKNNKIYYFLSGLVIFVTLAIIVLFSLGYRIDSDLKIAKNGQFSIETLLPNTVVIIDETKKIITTKEKEIVNISLAPKVHSVIVSHEDFFPWIKEVKVSSDQNTKVSPIYVYQNPSGSIITKNDPEYWKIMSDIDKNLPPQKNSHKISKDESVHIWVENNTIMAKVNDNSIEVIKPENPIRNLDFYKNRNNALVFSSGNGVYVVEINKEGTQNFMPIYKGERPEFLLQDENFIFIQDFQNLMQVII